MSKSTSAVDCLQTYLPFWRARGLSFTDVNMICHFLFSHGAYKEIIRFNLECLEKEDPVSWHYLGKVLQWIDSGQAKPIYEAIKNYINDQRKWDEFTTSDLFESLFPEELELKQKQLQRKIQIKERHRQTLIDQIRVFNQSRNYNIEKQTIQKFIKFFPQDSMGPELLNRFEKEELQRFFHRYQNERREMEAPSPKTFTEEEIAQLEKYFQEAQAFLSPRAPKKSGKKEKESTGNEKEITSLVFFFLFLEDYAHALQLATTLPPSLSKDWLYLDLLLLNKKFAEALAYLHELEEHYEADPHFYAAKVYYVAQCFWGLGDHRKAIELMDNLTQIHPDYRLASSLLKEWKLEL